ncbi:MAG: DoxX family protein [Acidobacteriota bacterium]|jgi:putative oxidoreductase
MAKRTLGSKLMTGTNSGFLSFSLLIIRWAVGIILFVVGSGKVLGWFGGQGMAATVHNFARMGFSAPLVYLSSFTEFIGGGLLVLGFLTRPAAVAVTINMFVATMTMMPRGFFRGGAAYPFMLLVCALVILLAGPMSCSVDALVFGYTKGR